MKIQTIENIKIVYLLLKVWEEEEKKKKKKLIILILYEYD